jgi:hypothetical protein
MMLREREQLVAVARGCVSWVRRVAAWTEWLLKPACSRGHGGVMMLRTQSRAHLYWLLKSVRGVGSDRENSLMPSAS